MQAAELSSKVHKTDWICQELISQHVPAADQMAASVPWSWQLLHTHTYTLEVKSEVCVQGSKTSTLDSALRQFNWGEMKLVWVSNWHLRLAFGYNYGCLQTKDFFDCF